MLRSGVQAEQALMFGGTRYRLVPVNKVEQWQMEKKLRKQQEEVVRWKLSFGKGESF